ncbi:Gfo/Idh/MocA family protein [Tunturibacter empetritectus]|uniref:Dehydrogenase n=1 Tax=Tunturiibacter lichenicola TaxID=2051959 RepID=A0A7W8N4K0_9BACT|nr:Gfo/Idh/MocA family oxidoreductase [Edaphobacter lichenicola]MBB5344598.1 putative dehydrogenase [Edaphobacter lichenicola]
MTQSPVRFAILGFGHHAIRRLLPAFPKCEHATLSGMWRRDHTAALANCAEYKIPHCFATREELCSSPNVDVVFITSPDAMHRDDTLLALKHGKAVLCEKPLAMSATQAEEMNRAANAADLLFGVAQNFRYNRSLEWMRQQITAGLIGKPQLARAEYCYPATNSARKWIIDATLAYGGPIGDVGVHCIDALRFVLGEDVISVDTLARKDASSGKVEAVASLQMEMTGNVFATVTTSARTPYRSLVEVNGSEGVMTAEGGLTVDRPVEIVVRRAGDVVERVTVDNGDGYTRMMDSFAVALRGGPHFAATGEDGVHNMQALDAAIKSWRSGSRERL